MGVLKYAAHGIPTQTDEERAWGGGVEDRMLDRIHAAREREREGEALFLER